MLESKQQERSFQRTDWLSVLFSLNGGIDRKSFVMGLIFYCLIDRILYGVFQVLKYQIQAPAFIVTMAFLLPLGSTYILYALFWKRVGIFQEHLRLHKTLVVVLVFSVYTITTGLLPFIPDSINPPISWVVNIVSVGAFFFGKFFIFGGLYAAYLCAKNGHGLQKRVFTVGMPRAIFAAFLLSFLTWSMGFELNYGHRYAYFSSPILSIKVKNNDATAQLELAHSYATGVGIRKDLNRAIELYQAAYRNSLYDAAYYLGLAFEEKGNTREADIWFSNAVRHGNDFSAEKLGKLKIKSGQGNVNGAEACDVRSSQESNLDACRREALMGGKEALYKYALILRSLVLNELASPSDMKKLKTPSNVLFWMERAAMAGDIRASYLIADFYQNGVYARVNMEKAAEWNSVAVENGYYLNRPRKIFLSILTHHNQ